MTTGRIAGFSDGVLAIIITIMVLELKVPEGVDLAALEPVLPVFLSYVLSFLYVGIYWNNHHHLMHACKRVDGRLLWANLHLLFWLSLIPFTTGWLGENRLASLPVALYGVVLFMAAVAYAILQSRVLRQSPADAPVRVAMQGDWKGRFSPVFYAMAVLVAFVLPWAACVIYVVVAIIWIVPDRRIETALENELDR